MSVGLELRLLGFAELMLGLSAVGGNGNAELFLGVLVHLIIALHSPLGKCCGFLVGVDIIDERDIGKPIEEHKDEDSQRSAYALQNFFEARLLHLGQLFELVVVHVKRIKSCLLFGSCFRHIFKVLRKSVLKGIVHLRTLNCKSIDLGLFPILVRVLHEHGVVVLGIASNLLAKPSWTVECSVLARKLNLGNGEALVVAVKLVDLKGALASFYQIACLVDNSRFANLEQLHNLLGGNLLLPLKAASTTLVANTLDCNETFLAFHANAHCALRH